MSHLSTTQMLRELRAVSSCFLRNYSCLSSTSGFLSSNRHPLAPVGISNRKTHLQIELSSVKQVSFSSHRNALDVQLQSRKEPIGLHFHRDLSTGPSFNPLDSEHDRNEGQGGNNHKDQHKKQNARIRRTLAGGLILSASLFSWKSKQTEEVSPEPGTTSGISIEKLVPEQFLKSKQVNPNLPVFHMSEVSTHYNSNTKIWVSFNRGVYDVTEFVAQHPGGNRVLLGAGGSLEPFWELYPIHQRPDVLEILEKYRIGNLAEEDVIIEGKEQTDHFKEEPRRHPALMVRSQRPFNGETPPQLLIEKFLTPNDLFYVRNHLPVPEVDAKSYQLEVEGVNIPKPKSFTLAQLQKLPKVELSATIQCGGNRRSEMGVAKPVAGLTWSGGAIGNANWAGVRLRDVLASAGFKAENYKNPEKIHVQFEGMDSDPSGECYGASVPLSYILDGNFNPILAYEMNSKTLPLDHGFPIRVILPGIVGSRSVKWLSRIIISEQENQSPWQQRDYKAFASSVTLETVNFSDAPAIMDTPPTSYICSHENAQEVPKGVEIFKGYAFSGGGRNIIRVEVSADKGKTWTVAKLIETETKKGARNWSWVLWEMPIDFTLLKGEHQIWVKAVDSGYNQQTEEFRNIWNYRGLLSNAYHKINVKIK